jgi:hypothetical protein
MDGVSLMLVVRAVTPSRSIAITAEFADPAPLFTFPLSLVTVF